MKPLLITVALVTALPALAAPIRVDVSRDTWVSGVGREAEGNNGAAARIKVKGLQELSLLDIDTVPLKGHVIASATLHLKNASKDILQRATVSSVSSPWAEGAGRSYDVIKGAACWNFAEQGIRRWSLPTGDITTVICGQGNSLWRFADPTPPDGQGWQALQVSPRVIAARVAGLSYGFALYDDVGSEYTRNGNQFSYHQLPNRMLFSRDQNRASAPWFGIELGAEDRQPPQAIASIAQVRQVLPPGEAIISWTTPADAGPAGTLGFFARYAARGQDDWEHATPIPQYMVPLAGEPGKPVTMHLHDLALPKDQPLTLLVRPVDAAGNIGPVTSAQFRPSDAPAAIALDEVALPLPAPAAPLQAGGLTLSVIDTLDKVSPVTGRLTPAHNPAYLTANHLFSAADKRVELHAARNEFASFQVLLTGAADSATLSLAFDNPALKPALYRFRNVKTKTGPMPDPLIPVDGSISIPAKDEAIAGQTNASFVADVYVPHDLPPGRYPGTLTLKLAGAQPATLSLRVNLTVWNFTLPDHLSFLPEMNCYGLPDAEERAFYRLAHEHRTCLNRLGYNWRGQPNDGCAPTWDPQAQSFDFTAYDRRFGPLLDGSAFADLPRKGVPVDAFYLPLCENWPIPIEPHFKGGYWIESALDTSYRPQWVNAARLFAAHLNQKKWNQTFFEFYMNNKVYFKKDDWRNCSAPWVFDEPATTQDFWALRWYATAFHQAVSQAQGPAHLLFRADVSRPQFQRNLFDGLLDVNVVGQDYHRYHRMVLDRKARDRQLVITYGSSNAVDQSNVQPAAWCLDAWTMGLDGVLPWQTVGNADSWTNADELSIFYPAGPMHLKSPAASVRLKAYREGQQMVEYLTLLQQAGDAPRFAVAAAVRDALKLAPVASRRGEDDAGRLDFSSLAPQDLWRLRMRVGAMLDRLHPAYRDKLIDLAPPARDIRALPACGLVD